MLHEFLGQNRQELIDLTREGSPIEPSLALPPKSSKTAFGSSSMLSQSDWKESETRPRASCGDHGRDLLRLGFTVGQVVEDYGDICQAVTELAITND